MIAIGLLFIVFLYDVYSVKKLNALDFSGARKYNCLSNNSGGML